MNVYFEAAAMILVFVSLGNYLEDLAKTRTKSSLEKLVSLVPEKWDETNRRYLCRSTNFTNLSW